MFADKRRPWSHQELESLEKMAGELSVCQIIEQLNRSEKSIRTKAQRLGISLCTSRFDAHDAWLCRELYKEGLTIPVIAEKMELSRYIVSRIVYQNEGKVMTKGNIN